jgi:hypothetical protein
MFSFIYYTLFMQFRPVSPLRINAEGAEDYEGNEGDYTGSN